MSHIMRKPILMTSMMLLENVLRIDVMKFCHMVYTNKVAYFVFALKLKKNCVFWTKTSKTWRGN